MRKQRRTLSVYLTEVENKMLDDLEKQLNENAYAKIGPSKIFCIALRYFYDKEIKLDAGQK